MTHHVVSNHYTERTAYEGLSHWWAVQAKAEAGDPVANVLLQEKGIGTTTKLEVRHYRKHFYKWAVTTR